MKRALPLVLVIVVVTVVLLFLGMRATAAPGTVGIASGAALPGFSANAATPEQALSNFLIDVRRRDWGGAFASLERTNSNLTEQEFAQEWMGTSGGLRSFSNLESYDGKPLYAPDPQAQKRGCLPLGTPVGQGGK